MLSSARPFPSILIWTSAASSHLGYCGLVKWAHDVTSGEAAQERVVELLAPKRAHRADDAVDDEVDGDGEHHGEEEQREQERSKEPDKRQSGLWAGGAGAGRKAKGAGRKAKDKDDLDGDYED